MSTITPAAKAAQDQARRQNGEFGNQQHSAPHGDIAGEPFPSSEQRQSRMVEIVEGEWDEHDDWHELDRYAVDARLVLDQHDQADVDTHHDNILDGGLVDEELDVDGFEEAGLVRNPHRSYRAEITDPEAFAEYARQRSTGERPGYVDPNRKYGVPSGRDLFEHTSVHGETLDVDTWELDAMCDAVHESETDRSRQQAQAELRAWADLSRQLGYYSELPKEGDFTREQVAAARGQIDRALDSMGDHPAIGTGNTDAIEQWAREEIVAEGTLTEEAAANIDDYMDWQRYGVNRIEARAEIVTLGDAEFYVFTDK